MIKISDAEYIGGYQLELTFNNGEVLKVDLQNNLNGKAFKALQDPKMFTQFGLINGTLEWVNGADIAPEHLYELALRQNFKSFIKN